MEAKPIPALYACYLLHSTKWPSSLYIGSTPNPRRRLAQHNGDAKGGAIRTARNNLRPWEMGLIIRGFPSNIAALQFEWAWQNTHITRHIADDKRITKPKTIEKRSPKTGRTRRRPARPQISLVDKLRNLHLLLQTPSFTRWPLEVRFFCKDIHRSWQKWTATLESEIHRDVRVSLDLGECGRHSMEKPPNSPVFKTKTENHDPASSRRGIEGLNVSYTFLKSHMEKSHLLLADRKKNSCAVCTSMIQPLEATTLVCPRNDCASISHLPCLARRFMDEEGQSNLVVPTVGTCPGCSSKLPWIDLVQEMSVRTRDEKETARLMRKAKKISPKTMKAKRVLSSDLIEESTNDEASEHIHYLESDANSDHSLSSVLHGSLLDEEWDKSCDDDEDVMSVSSAASTGVVFPRLENRQSWNETISVLQRVIEDSEWDDAEVLN